MNWWLEPIKFRRVCLIASLFVWIVPFLYTALTKEIVAEDLGMNGWWVGGLPIFILALGYSVTRRHVLPWLKAGSEAKLHCDSIIIYLLLSISIAFLPVLLLLVMNGGHADTASGGWIGWARIFISTFYFWILLVELFQFDLAKNKKRLLAYCIVFVFWILLPIFQIFDWLDWIETFPPFELSSSVVDKPPIPTMLGSFFYTVASWHYLAFILVALLVLSDRATSLKSGKMYPLLFALMSLIYSSHLGTNYLYDRSLHFELSPATRAFIAAHGPKKIVAWFIDRNIMYPPDDDSVWLTYGPLSD